MKAGKEHRVALSDEAIALLKSLPREDGNPLLFIGTAKTGGLSENAMNNVLGRMGRSEPSGPFGRAVKAALAVFEIDADWFRPAKDAAAQFDNTN